MVLSENPLNPAEAGAEMLHFAAHQWVRSVVAQAILVIFV
jgi:hypothetical protein